MIAQEGLPLGQPHHPSRVIPVGWLDNLPPCANVLRDYQRIQVSKIAFALQLGHTKILAQAPTGSGKTHTISAIVAAAATARLRVLVLATRSRLVRQLHDRLTDFGITHGVVAAPFPELRNMNARVQVASVDTLNRRKERMPMPAADLVVFDEAHLATATTRLKLLDSFPAAVRIGFTATPARKSGKSLAVAFDKLILGPKISELTAVGMLVPTRIFNTPVLTQTELQSLPKDMENDFQAKDLAELLNRPKLIGDVVGNWLRIANGKRTLCFAVNKAHGAALLESFLRHGIAAEMLTDSDDESVREEVIARLTAGHTLVVINCFLLSYGVDVPAVECVILARPTRSLTMYLQMVGRGLRAAPGKADCVVIDHGHVVENLGLPQRDHDWTLRTDSNVNTDIRVGFRRGARERTRTCGACAALWLTSEHGNACPECGWIAPIKARAVSVQEAELAELTAANEAVDAESVARFYREACGWYRWRWPDRWRDHPKKGRWWAWIQTREKFQISESRRMPTDYWEIVPMAASSEVAGWLQHRIIKWARSKAKAA